jgi:nuclear pore complex protein Nup98-Nup96
MHFILTTPIVWLPVNLTCDQKETCYRAIMVQSTADSMYSRDSTWPSSTVLSTNLSLSTFPSYLSNSESQDKQLTIDCKPGFGTSTPAFGAKPSGFGAATTTAGSSLFGGTTATANSGTGFGGFGSSNTNTSSPFGGASAGGGLFGSANKPAFGGAATTSSPFGGGATNTGFGGTSSGFGASGTALGGALEQCQGTGSVPFTPTVEKEPASSTNAQNSFQSISFQQPYQKFSPEELRLADYAQGRKYGNASGTAGAFGTSTGFGGFGSNNTNASTTAFGTANTGSSLFGGGASSTPFGQAQPASTGFGGTSTTGGLFGQQKPATPSGGLFGAAPAATPAAGGLFGSNSGTTGGFGSNTTSTFGNNNATSGTSLFGNNNQSKPGFSFGGAQPAATTSGFGSTTAATGGFGSGTGGSSLFGSNTAQNTSSPFGGAAAQPAASNPFGGFGNTQNQAGTSSLFGNNSQAKPATSLFGNTGASATGGGLFGNNNTTNTPSNPFGGSTTNTSSLFGAKPAATGTGTSLFGNTGSNTTANSGGSLFGAGFGSNQNNQNQQQPNNGNSLFGGLNNNQPKPSLFGQSQPAGGSLFGGNNNQSSGGGLFGSLNNNNNNTQQPAPQPSLFSGSSLFPPQQGLTASINDPAAFGTASMFSNFGSPEVHNPGPIATPLSSLSKQKKSGILPMYKMNPGSASRFSTPQKRGFGFSYSTYGTPGSASSTSSTPLLTFGNSMLGASLGRGLSKSMSTSSLRGSYNSSFNREDSILAPGAFSASPSSRFNSTGSMKKLVINRGIRQDLFTPPPKESSPATNSNGILKKRVSFDASTVGGSNGNVSGATSPLKQMQSNATPSSEELGFLRSSSSRSNSTNGNATKSPSVDPPEMEQVKGNELAIVPEEEAPVPAAITPRSKPASQDDQELGTYWMTPTKEQILDMNRMQRQKVSGFTVGRKGVGTVTFDTPVDLSNIDLDGIFDKIVILTIRSATVYSDQSKKPPVGKGLNVPSTISLENSWPRGKDKRNPTHEKSGPRFQKHIERLKRVPDTNFLDYNKDTGVWTFTVEHFTTYGLDYDDETDAEGVSEFVDSPLSPPPDTPTPKSKTPEIYRSADSSASNSRTSRVTESDPDDTFDFKKKNLKVFPGAFDHQELYEDEDMQDEDEQDVQSFLDERSAGSQSDDGIDEPMDQDDHHHGQELVRIQDQEMAGSFPQPDDTVEHDDYSQDTKDVMETPGAIMRARMRAMRTSGSPQKRPLNLEGDDWTEMLQQTISPKKQDREELKRMRDSINTGGLLEGTRTTVAKARVVSDGRGFATSIDLMHSLFGEAKSPAKATKVPVTKGVGFQVCLSPHAQSCLQN